MKAQWSLYVPPGLTLTNSMFCPHSVFMCFVWISEQTAIISLYNFNWVVFRCVRKIAKSDLTSSYPSVRMEQLGCHWTDSHEIWYLSIFRKYVEKIPVSLKSDKNKGHFTWRPVYTFLIISRLEWNMFQTKVVEKLKTHILCSVTFISRKLCRLWDNVEKFCRAGQGTDGNMAHAHCMLDT